MRSLYYPSAIREWHEVARTETELFERVEREAGVPAQSLEITITETPKVNWGIRGQNAADLALGYQVEV